MKQPIDEVEAYSQATNRHYPNWDALVAAEGNGYVVVGMVVDGPHTMSGVALVGPFPTRDEARKVQARKRQAWANESKPLKVKTQIRVLWKDKEQLLLEESAARDIELKNNRACPLCGVWVCSRCGWRRINASRVSETGHQCAKCDGKRGKMLPVRHSGPRSLEHLKEYEKLKAEGQL